MIDINNFESYLFLYHEGELDAQGRAEVEKFLEEHPDIKEEDELYYDPDFQVPSTIPSTTGASKSAKPAWRWVAAACALIAVGSSVFFLAPEPNVVPKPTETVATIEPVKEISEAVQPTSVKPTSDQRHKAAKRFQASATAEPQIIGSKPELVAEATLEEVVTEIEKAETAQPAKELAEAAMGHHDGEPIIIETNLLAQVVPAEVEVVEVNFLAEVVSTDPGREMMAYVTKKILEVPNFPNKLVGSFLSMVKEEIFAENI